MEATYRALDGGIHHPCALGDPGGVRRCERRQL